LKAHPYFSKIPSALRPSFDGEPNQPELKWQLRQMDLLERSKIGKLFIT